MATTARRCGQGAAKPGCGELQDRPHPCTAVSTPSVKRGLHGTHDAQEGRHREGDGVAGGWRRATAGKEATQRGYGHGSKGSATPESSSELISFSNKTSHPFARSGSGQAQDGALGKHEREETSLVLPPGALSPRVLHTAPPRSWDPRRDFQAYRTAFLRAGSTTTGTSPCCCQQSFYL